MSSVAVDNQGRIWVSRAGTIRDECRSGAGMANSSATTWAIPATPGQRYLHEQTHIGLLRSLEFKLNKADRTWKLTQCYGCRISARAKASRSIPPPT